ncbi:hypothetical protein [Pedobacter sp.]|uniref:hypothetical protein n=1 Tax=Pedobacter sp. TaxID=1411316 RepID=UPI003D7FF3BE
MLRLLVKSLAKEFYQQHAGFFLVGIYLLFGIGGPGQVIGYQKALLLAGISSPIGMTIVSFSWFLYALKVYFFINQKLALTQFQFINETGKLARNIQLKLWLSLYAIILLPVIIYVFALVCVSVNYHFFYSLFCIIIVSFTLLFGLSFLSYQKVNTGFLTPERQRIHTGNMIKRPYFSWPLIHLVKDQPLMLLMCKLSSLVLFKAMLWMFADVGNDTRVLLVAILASVLCHAVLVFTLLRFEVTFLNFSKSLPISTFKHLSHWFLIFVTVLIPEWILLIISSQYKLHSIIHGFLFGLTSLFFLLTVLYIVKLNMGNYLKWLLFYFFIAMWAILGHKYFLFSIVVLSSCTIYYLASFHKTDLQAWR